MKQVCNVWYVYVIFNMFWKKERSINQYETMLVKIGKEFDYVLIEITLKSIVQS